MRSSGLALFLLLAGLVCTPEAALAQGGESRFGNDPTFPLGSPAEFNERMRQGTRTDRVEALTFCLSTHADERVQSAAKAFVAASEQREGGQVFAKVIELTLGLAGVAIHRCGIDPEWVDDLIEDGAVAYGKGLLGQPFEKAMSDFDDIYGDREGSR